MPLSAGAHRLLGQVLLAKAQGQAARRGGRRRARKAANDGPPDPQGAVALAQASLRLERPKEAVAALESVADRAHGPSFLLLYGEALERDGQSAKAEDVYQSLLRRIPRTGPRRSASCASTSARASSTRKPRSSRRS